MSEIYIYLMKAINRIFKDKLDRGVVDYLEMIEGFKIELKLRYSQSK
ncbi:hypothetical protein [Clostridium sp. K04]|nr:hypothetical protein [Clostridium sp. K04]MBX9184571.1 hypothetical protein [Clostridium sp. K04]